MITKRITYLALGKEYHSVETAKKAIKHQFYADVFENINMLKYEDGLRIIDNFIQQWKKVIEFLSLPDEYYNEYIDEEEHITKVNSYLKIKRCYLFNGKEFIDKKDIQNNIQEEINALFGWQIGPKCKLQLMENIFKNRKKIISFVNAILQDI